MVDNLAAKIGGKAAKAAESGGDEVVGGMRGMYDNIFDATSDNVPMAGEMLGEATEAVTKQVDSVLDDLSQVTGVASKSGKEISTSLNSANKGLSDSIRSLKSSRDAKAAELDRIHRAIMGQEKLEPEKQVKSVLDALKQRRAQLAGQSEMETRQLNELSLVLRTSITPGQEARALQQISQSSIEGLDTVPGILQWQSQMQGVFRQNKKILSLTSKNIGSDTKFLQEFLALKRNPIAAEKLELWSANPSNFRKLESLMQRDKIFDIVSAGKMTRRQKILGITPKDMAKRLGLGAAAAGAGVVGLYSWFSGSNHPKRVANQSAQMNTSVQSLKVTGEGAQIIAGVQQSMINIQALGIEVDQKLSGPEAPAATTKYIQGMSQELMSLMNSLKKWKIVVQNSNDPNAARAEGKKLYQFIQTQVTGINDLGRKLGISTPTPSTSGSGIANLTTQRGPDTDNLKKIQGFLNINESGTLDAATIKALRSLEYRFNKRARTDQFTGTFVVPEAGHVISYDNLATAYKKIQKYDESEYA